MPPLVTDVRTAWLAGDGRFALDAAVADGEPPFTVGVAWGDGTSSATAVSADGNFSVRAPNGTVPAEATVVVTDAAGLVARGSSETSETPGGAFSVAIDPVAYTAEVGVPLRFALNASVPAGAYSAVVSCAEAGPGAYRPAAPLQNLSCTFAAPGVANVSVWAVEQAAPYDTATARLLAPVVGPPTLAASVPTGPVDAGAPAYVPVAVDGGVPPYRLAWSLGGNGSAGRATIAGAGSLLIPVVATTAGSEPLVVAAIDALGATVANGSVTIDARGPLVVALNVTDAAGPNGSELFASGAIDGGTPPFDWAFGTAPTKVANATLGGSAPSFGPVAWNGTVRVEGDVTVRLAVVDAAGVLGNASATVGAVAPVAVAVRPGPTAPARWSVTVTIAGGAPPFRLWANGSAGGAANRTVDADGTYPLEAAAVPAANVSVDVVVRDGLGGMARATVRTSVAGGVTASAGSVATAAGIVAIAVVAAGGVYLARRRHRQRASPDAPVPDAAEVLRRVLAPADGADRGTVELLAEEQGVPLATVRSAIDRLVAEGRILAERGSDGEEILAWRDPT